VVVRAEDTFDSLKDKVRLATILGTIQSTLTSFQFLSEEWVKNTEEERLLGVSLTGIMDNEVMSGVKYDGGFTGEHGGKLTLPMILEQLRDIARETNESFSKQLGISASVAITAIKPSGTVSQLVDSASGIHSRHSPFYIRRIRMDKKDPIYSFLKSKNIEVEDEQVNGDTTAVFSFPIKSPDGAITRKDKTAIQQLELWLLYQRHWCEHKPSVTITVKEEEWFEVGAWVYKHFDEVSGISFLPFSDHIYVQAPYEDLTEEEYNKKKDGLTSEIDWGEFIEEEDNTESSQQFACVGGQCEL